MKRELSFLLALLVCLSAGIGCGSESVPVTDTTDTQTTVTDTVKENRKQKCRGNNPLFHKVISFPFHSRPQRQHDGCFETMLSDFSMFD